MNENPAEDGLLSYASDASLARRGEMFREGDFLVVRSGMILPRRCVMCGEAVGEKESPRKHVFTWDASFQRTRGESTLEMRRSGTVEAFLCVVHQRRWRRGRRAGLAGLIASGLMMAAGVGVVAVNELSDVPRHTGLGICMVVEGFAIAIVSLFLFTLRTRTVECEKIEGGYLYLRGAGENFLASLKANE